MKHVMNFLAVTIAAVVFPACGKATAPVREDATAADSASSGEKAGGPTPPSAEPITAAASPDSAPPPEEVTVDENALRQALVGTSWAVNGYLLEFGDEDTVSVRGGALSLRAPDGVEAGYTFEQGKLRISALDATQTASWDGRQLVMAGNVAHPFQP